MFDKIASMIKEKGLKPTDCEYHTIQLLDNGGKVRVLVTKADPTVAHVEYVCPNCGNIDYTTIEYKKVSKASKIRMRVECSKCKKKFKVEKLKAKKK